jgi:hypothetical protein
MTPNRLKIRPSQSHSCESRNPEKEISNGDLRYKNNIFIFAANLNFKIINICYFIFVFNNFIEKKI